MVDRSMVVRVVAVPGLQVSLGTWAEEVSVWDGMAVRGRLFDSTAENGCGEWVGAGLRRVGQTEAVVRSYSRDVTRLEHD